MATAAKAEVNLSKIIAHHVCRCATVPCAFAGVLAAGGIQGSVRYFNNPPITGDLTPDSYTPGHGLRVFFKRRYSHMFLNDERPGPSFSCDVGPIECTILCPCECPAPHSWMFDTFCLKYSWYVKNAMLTTL